MIAYVTVGADYMNSAQHFYDSLLPALRYALDFYHGDLSYSLPRQVEGSFALPEFYVKSPFNGDPATFGNGSMVAFEAYNQEQVRRLHAAALAPGFRDAYGADFYVGYLRDPQVNKVAIFSSHPDAPGRDGWSPRSRVKRHLRL